MPQPPARSKGSRRRRLWELPSHAHCPVIGVCLPIEQLRKVLAKHLNGVPQHDEYELHCGAVQECSFRSATSEALQKALDARHSVAVRQCASATSAMQLADKWRAAVQAADIAGALWAVLTHARLSPALEMLVLHEVHMIQHQAGATQRADLGMLESLKQSCAQLTENLRRQELRAQQEQARLRKELDQQDAELVRHRGLILTKEAMILQLQSQNAELQNAAPELVRLRGQAQRADDLQERNRLLLRDMQALQVQLDEHKDELVKSLSQAQTSADFARQAPHGEAAQDLSGVNHVLCVGGRNASVAQYRKVVQEQGLRFTHHDGGLEQNQRELDANLAAADLVICQTGCLSHDAYWLVKDYCKRHKKRCVYLANPSLSSFIRVLKPNESRDGVRRVPVELD